MVIVEMKFLKFEFFLCGNYDDCYFFIDFDFLCKLNWNGVYFLYKFFCNKYIWCV